MSKHTKWPWRAIKVTDRMFNIENELACIASVYGPSSVVAEPAEANARLIAAAPELLETIRTVLDDYKRPDWRNLKRNIELIELMEAAIAKAEGK